MGGSTAGSCLGLWSTMSVAKRVRCQSEYLEGRGSSNREAALLLNDDRRAGQRISDAQAAWFSRPPGPLFVHVTRLRPFQILDRAARARLVRKQPQANVHAKVQPSVASVRRAYETCFMQSADLSVLQFVAREFGRIARGNSSKQGGVEDLMELVQAAVPVALRAGRAQMLVGGGLVSVLTHGGIRGKALAPISIYEYSRQHLLGLATNLTQAGVDGRSGEQWLSAYREMVKEVPPSQQGC